MAACTIPLPHPYTNSVTARPTLKYAGPGGSARLRTKSPPGVAWCSCTGSQSEKEPQTDTLCPPSAAGHLKHVTTRPSSAGSGREGARLEAGAAAVGAAAVEAAAGAPLLLASRCSSSACAPTLWTRCRSLLGGQLRGTGRQAPPEGAEPAGVDVRPGGWGATAAPDPAARQAAAEGGMVAKARRAGAGAPWPARGERLRAWEAQRRAGCSAERIQQIVSVQKVQGARAVRSYMLNAGPLRIGTAARQEPRSAVLGTSVCDLHTLGVWSLCWPRARVWLAAPRSAPWPA